MAYNKSNSRIGLSCVPLFNNLRLPSKGKYLKMKHFRFRDTVEADADIEGCAARRTGRKGMDSGRISKRCSIDFLKVLTIASRFQPQFGSRSVSRQHALAQCNVRFARIDLKYIIDMCSIDFK